MTYRWVEHTAELQLEIDAPTESGVFADALAALSQLLGGANGGPFERHEVVVDGSDPATLLADWLQELVFLAETEDFIPERLASIDLAGGGARTVVEGRRGSPPHLVKAVTYHGLELRQHNGRWHAQVVFDV